MSELLNYLQFAKEEIKRVNYLLSFAEITTFAKF